MSERLVQLPDDSPDAQGRLRALLLFSPREYLEVGLETTATVFNDIALYHHARVAYAEAEPLYKRAIATLEKILPSD